MTIIIGLLITLGCIGGGYMAMGGHIEILWQPMEYVIICGSALGTFVVANPWKTIKDSGKGIVEALTNAYPKREDFLDVLDVLHSMMRSLRSRPKAEVEAQLDAPEESPMFMSAPNLLKNKELTNFICDYCRLIIMGNARTHEIEALMDEEIQTIRHDKLKSYHALTTVGDGLPALGIVAAVLGVIKAMGSIDKPPEILGHLIAAALVGTFAGIFFSYAVIAPIATQVKIVREKKMRTFIVVKQALLAFMNGAMPLVALEHGRKVISASDRPTISEVEDRAISPGIGEPSISAKAA